MAAIMSSDPMVIAATNEGVHLFTTAKFGLLQYGFLERSVRHQHG